MGIKNNIRQILDSYIGGLGYLKANIDNSILAPVFAGENTDQGQGITLMGSSSNLQDKVEKMALMSSWVISDLNVIGNLAASSNLNVVIKDDIGGTRPINNHPFELLWKRPNRFMSNSYLVKYTTSWLALRGEAYWMLVPNQVGDLAEIWPLPSNRIKPIADDKDYISGYEYSPKGSQEGKVILPVDNVIYFREPNIMDYHRGQAKPLLAPLVTDKHAVDWNIDTFENDVTLRTIISIPSGVNRNIYSQIKQEIIDQLVKKGQRYIIARGGDLSAQSLGMSQADMEYLKGREFTRAEIDRMFGIPEGFWAKDTNRNTAETAKSIVIELTVWPLLVSIADEITAQILPKFYNDGTNTSILFDDVRPKNQEQEIARDTLDREVMTVNEIRIALGLGIMNTPYGNLPYPLRDHRETLAMISGASLTNLQAFVTSQTELVTVSALEAPTKPLESFEANIDVNIATEPEKATQGEFGAFKAVSEVVSGDILRIWRRAAKKRAKAKAHVTYDFSDHDLDDHAGSVIRQAVSLARGTAGINSLFAGGLDHVPYSLPSAKKAIPIGASGDPDLESLVIDHDSQLDTLIKQAISGGAGTSFADSLTQLAEADMSQALNLGAGRTLEDDERGDAGDVFGVIPTSAQGLADDIDAGLYDDLLDSTVDQAGIDATAQAESDGLSEEATAAAVTAALLLAGSKQQQAEERIEARKFMWLATLTSLYSFAQRKRANINLVWVRGATKQGCSTCLDLDGVVQSAELWDATPFYPQAKNGSLVCGGFQCDCRFEVTSDPPTTGELPAIEI